MLLTSLVALVDGGDMRAVPVKGIALGHGAASGELTGAGRIVSHGSTKTPQLRDCNEGFRMLPLYPLAARINLV